MGWSPLVGRPRLSDTATTVTPTKAIVFDAAQLLKLCDEDREFGYQFMSRMAQVLAQRLSATRMQLLHDWGRNLPDGRALGVATVESFRSYVAQVAEVSMEEGVPRVHKVWCAVDCGIAVNPEIVRAQMEGGIGYGLGAVMRNQITFFEGEVEQENFPDYEPLRITDMPRVEVHIVASNEAPTGVGEPGVPPIAPAVANAVFAATGQRLRALPLRLAPSS